MKVDYKKLGAKGGIRRWAKVNPKKRSEAMRILATKRWAKEKVRKDLEEHDALSSSK